jgi:hypothetical protein
MFSKAAISKPTPYYLYYGMVGLTCRVKDFAFAVAFPHLQVVLLTVYYSSTPLILPRQFFFSDVFRKALLDVFW